MAERVRLLVWDLDDTFWRGTLCEGGVTFVERHREIVIALARRGIVSTICSKNDHESVRRLLVEHGAWDYFVAPSVSWAPKGPRLRDLIATLGLRAATVLFLDDNPLNLEEARRFCPDVQVAGPEAITGLLDNPLLAGKDDRELTRLRQYKALELRQTEQREAGADLAAFLRDSRIEVAVETDVKPHLDRFVELINRTNQLNFTKRRLPEDAEAARVEARRLIGGYQRQAALVRVRDKYGDHGFCGVYVHNSEARRLEHFAFSCRILGLGVERWLYQTLGRPQIEVTGEVLADLDDPAPVDWISPAAPGERRAETLVARVGRITARGACEIGAILHYFHYHCDDVVGEYHEFRDGGVFRIGHSVFLRHAARGLDVAQMQAARRLGYVERDFASRLYDADAPNARGHLVLLGFGADLNQPLLRHRASGLVVPFTAYPSGWEGRPLAQARDEEIPGDHPAWARAALRFAQEECDEIGLTPADAFEARLREAAARMAPSARIVLLGLLSRDYVHADGRRRVAEPRWAAFNAAMRAVAAADRRVAMVDVDDLLDDADIEDRLHFRRAGLFKIYGRVRAAALDS